MFRKLQAVILFLFLFSGTVSAQLDTSISDITIFNNPAITKIHFKTAKDTAVDSDYYGLTIPELFKQCLSLTNYQYIQNIFISEKGVMIITQTRVVQLGWLEMENIYPGCIAWLNEKSLKLK